ncbi:MAG TPA: hypothetical protein VKB79_07090 [Bryobacteraceae bacterium]|nr:hypothetical protein [Bryobacteraceae bacterium]
MLNCFTFRHAFIATAAAATLALFAIADVPVNPTAGLKSGKLELKSAGALAFGPDGVLFVGDSIGGSIAAIDTNDKVNAKSVPVLNVENLDAKIAAIVGIPADQLVINDMKVNPASKNVYISAARGKGPDAQPLIVKLDAQGNLSSLSLDNVKFAQIALADAPESNPSARQNPRTVTITDMNYVNGNLLVAGMSNEEWSSALRSFPVPFRNAEPGTQVQIWHDSHGRYETASPVRTFVPFNISGQQYVIAAYTCTPLVKIPVSDLKAGAKVKGQTIADLGAGNQPLDMVPYRKNGKDFILVANSAFGLLKVEADHLETYPTIDSPTKNPGTAGMPFEKITSVTNVKQLAQVDAANAVVLTANAGAGPAFAPGPPVGPMTLKTIALP